MSANKQTILIWEALSLFAGGQQVAYKIIEAVRDSFKVVLVAPEEGELTRRAREAGATVEILPLGTYSVGRKTIGDVIRFCLRFPVVLLGAYKLAKRYRPDLIYANASRTFIWAALLGQISNIPVIWHIHNIYRDGKTRKLIGRAGKLPSVRKIICVSNTVGKTLPSGLQVEIIENGVDLSRFAKKKPAGVLERFGIEQESSAVSTISAVMPSKNQLLLARAAPFILKKIKNVSFLIIGGVRKEGKDYYRQIREHIKAAELERHFIFTGHRRDIPDILNEISLNVITSEEAFPFILLESWASEVPTIAPRLGVIPELITHGKNGLIYNHNDPHDLAAKIISLLEQPELRRKIVANGLESVLPYSMQNFRTRILTTINSVLKK